jgi:hypothetical protein
MKAALRSSCSHGLPRSSSFPSSSAFSSGFLNGPCLHRHCGAETLFGLLAPGTLRTVYRLAGRVGFCCRTGTDEVSATVERRLQMYIGGGVLLLILIILLVIFIL